MAQSTRQATALPVCAVFGAPLELSANVLLTYRDVMKFYLQTADTLTKKNKMYKSSFADVADIVIVDVINIWNKESVPTVSYKRAVQLLNVYHIKFTNLLKPYKSRKDNDSYIGRIDTFRREADHLFDILAASVLTHTNEKEAQLTNETPLNYEGQLLKFTNVVKGFQYRWFVINNKLGTLDYFEKEEHKRTAKARGSISLLFADVCPAAEDYQTFIINAKTGNYFKLKALNTKDRQEWINNLRSSISYFNRNLQNGRFPIGPNSVSFRFRNGMDENSIFYSTNSLNAPVMTESIYANSNISMISTNDDIFDPFRASSSYLARGNQDELIFNKEPFKNVNSLIVQMEDIFMSIVKDIDILAVSGSHGICFDQNLLLTKATCAATINCLKKCVTLIRNRRLYNSKLVNRKVDKQITSPHSSNNIVSESKNVGSVSSLPAAICSEDNKVNGDDIDISKILSAQSHDELTNKVSTLVLSSNQSSSSINSNFKFLLPIEAMDLEPCNPIDLTQSVEDSECYDKIQSEKDITCLEENRSLIQHLISQVKLGMDLTKVTLPTFILEKRSLLEMFSDYMAHPDLFLKISDETTPESRFKALVLWYVTSFHAGRKSTIAKKPYNPIIGETFHCMWHVPKNESNGDNETCHHLNFSAEQVSHHPPITAFYLECPSKGIRLNASIHTKSKFQGISITAQMVGKVTITIDKYGEEYQFAFPNAHAKNILSVPKMEFADKVSITCLTTKYSASIVFHSKPLFGNSIVNKITGEIKDPENQVLEKITGDWNDTIEFQNILLNKSIIINVADLKLFKKFVNPENIQKNHESRKLWHFVTDALNSSDIEKATKYKTELENRQRQSEKNRNTKKIQFPVKYFRSDFDGRWIFKNDLMHKTKNCDE